jgi:hypothetical protein
MTREETKTVILQGISDHLDPILRPRGFRRSKKSTDFRRNIGEANQKIGIFWRRATRHSDVSDAHITPMVRITIPRQGSQVREMVAAEHARDGYDCFTTLGTLGSFGPEANYVDWQLRGPEEAPHQFRSIASYIEHGALPFLDRYTDVRSFSEGWEQGDPLLFYTRRVFIVRAAAYVLLGKPVLAHSTLVEGCGDKLLLLEEYGSAIDYTACLVAQAQNAGEA